MGNTPTFYSGNGKDPERQPAKAGFFNTGPRTPAGQPSPIRVPSVVPPNARALGLRGRFKLNGIAREAMVQAMGEMIVNEVRLVRDAALHQGQLKLAQTKSVALRDYLEANTVISQQIEKISQSAEAEMVSNFHDEMQAIVAKHKSRLDAIDRASAGIEPRLIEFQRNAVQRWTDIQLGNIEARMTLILQRYAQQFEATLAQFVGSQLEGAPHA